MDCRARRWSLGVFIYLTGVALADAPNIILMMADDMGMGDTSAFQDFTGNRDDDQLHTPQMERLARMGVRFTDAHTPSSRCSPTRYGLLTGRYPWRNRLKHWVLFGSQGDPMIEADRPTIATMLSGAGYRTAMVGKWHVGLRYRGSDGKPAAGWRDADLGQPMHTTPLDHGFHFARFTSRSHGTSGPSAVANSSRKRNSPTQNVGPGHIHGRDIVGATGDGKQLVSDGANAYVLTKLGSRHSNHAMAFLESHVKNAKTNGRPFFLYYAANSNHSPYTPDKSIGGKPVAAAARTKSEQPMDRRHDYIYQNDVALGRLLDWLKSTADPRQSDRKLIDTTLVIFTSDNGAEKNSNIATGPFRSHKGSVYEGGHRVPFIVAWPLGGIGNGDPSTDGLTSDAPIGLQDLYATLAEIVGRPLPNLRAGEKGAEDSYSVLAAMRGESLPNRAPLFFNDHKEAKKDHAAAAIRIDSPLVKRHVFSGKWKLFFDAGLLRHGKADPYELFNLAVDPQETTNLRDKVELKPLIDFMTDQALLHRRTGGHRMVELASRSRTVFSWRAEANPTSNNLVAMFDGKPASEITVQASGTRLKMIVSAVRGERPLTRARFRCDGDGLGIAAGNGSADVDGNEAVVVRFDRDVIVESAELVAGDGVCGGFYRVGEASPLAIYCVDADNDAQDQSGMLSDVGVLKAGKSLRLDSSPHLAVEAAGQWRLASLKIRILN